MISVCSPHVLTTQYVAGTVPQSPTSDGVFSLYAYSLYRRRTLLLSDLYTLVKKTLHRLSTRLATNPFCHPMTFYREMHVVENAGVREVQDGGVIRAAGAVVLPKV